MALTGPYRAPEGFTIPNAYFRANATGRLTRPLVTVDVWASKEVADAVDSGAEGSESYAPITQLPLGFREIDPNEPTGEQIYAIVKAEMPELRDSQ
ncbi:MULTISPECIES: hypothetical protein [unclassified Rhizobium]|uniref:hypothetical protein n=1 Tax=unclassified Rhizobium TaxID=2613769 RepID=UPI001AEA5FF5|nr:MULTISPECIES: hypothetical protein [unclassified Rhizobium]MBP2459576.1 hypothetical protein [Rhizobium sp. PvP014]MBP2531870.1 hypothetical protein [Rhizobium sp. PvP099]